VEMALLNLAVNARDAMSEGGQIIVTARDAVISSDEPVGLKAGSYICLSVIDDGEGMDEQTLEHAVHWKIDRNDPGIIKQRKRGCRNIAHRYEPASWRACPNALDHGGWHCLHGGAIANGARMNGVDAHRRKLDSERSHHAGDSAIRHRDSGRSRIGPISRHTTENHD